MCGLAGMLAAREGQVNRTALEAMGAQLLHRGPDDGRVWIDEVARIGFAHRRLAIQDLSDLGRQPMTSQCGNFVIAYNGEVYNFLELRQCLQDEGLSFSGGSDTEVILQAISHWGIERSLRAFQGMFAFALWDREKQLLTLARDRFGEKPLYYGNLSGQFVFGSELKALFAGSDKSDEIDIEAVAGLLRHNYVPGPRSVFSNIKKLEPGTFLTVDRNQETKNYCYWSVASVLHQGAKFEGDYATAVNELDALLGATVERQMISDVPVGALLSGGVDSSLVVAKMQSLRQSPVKTFTIGFWDRDFDEAPYAEKIAQHLQTDHNTLFVSPADALNVIPTISQIYDEPFADSSQIPTLIVSELAKQHVTVCLSGDGGDEVFGGYTRYGSIGRAWQRNTRSLVLQKAAGVGSSIGNQLLRLFGNWHTFTPEVLDLFLSKATRRLGAASNASLEDYYRHQVSYWPYPPALMAGNSLGGSKLTQLCRQLPENLADHRTMMALDAVTYLPDDILTKVDRATMSTSLESRIPLLDHEIFAFACSLPLPYLVDDSGTGKRILRDLLSRYVPLELFDRPKSGFAIPLSSWLRGELRDWAEDLLSAQSLAAHGLFDANRLAVIWQQHLNNRTDWSFHLWGILMFQAWFRDHRSWVRT